MTGRQEELTERDHILADIVEAGERLEETEWADKEEGAKRDRELVDDEQVVTSIMPQVGQKSD